MECQEYLCPGECLTWHRRQKKTKEHTVHELERAGRLDETPEQKLERKRKEEATRKVQEDAERERKRAKEKKKTELREEKAREENEKRENEKKKGEDERRKEAERQATCNVKIFKRQLSSNTAMTNDDETDG